MKKKSLTENNNWKEGPHPLPSFQLSNNEVHIWSASLMRSAQDLTHFFSLLSPNEKERSKRFYFERDQKHFIAGRGVLRTLLGNYLGMEPAQIELSYGIYGKPALATNFHGGDLQFNLSHSKDEALYAFSWRQPVGIDIEYIQPLKDMDDFAFQFFTHNECKLIHSLPKDQKQETFFKIWTCKESFLKANGSGLTTPINEVEVFLGANGTASLASIGNDHEQAARWRLELFTPVVGYQSALAIERQGGKIMFHQIKNLFDETD